MGFNVVMVVNPAMLNKDIPDKIRATGAEVSICFSGETEDELLSLCRDADCIITHQSFFPFTPRVFRGLPKCRFLLTLSMGYDAIDVKAASEQGIGVVNLHGFCSEDVAEHSIALMLACARWITVTHNRTKAGERIMGGKLSLSSQRSHQQMTLLRGKTLGLIGFGSIARAVVPIARGFGMTVLAYDPHIDKAVFREWDIEAGNLKKLLEESDFVSIHANLTEESRHLIGLEQLKMMKPGAFIINTSRGGIIDEEALGTALAGGYIAGAGLDVTEQEPLPADSPLFSFDNVVLTGHSGGYPSPESSAAAAALPAEEVSRMMRGEWPLNLVNPEVREKYVARWGEMREPGDARGR